MQKPDRTRRIQILNFINSRRFYFIRKLPKSANGNFAKEKTKQEKLKIKPFFRVSLQKSHKGIRIKVCL